MLNEKVVLDFYLKRMEEDKIKFLQGREFYKKDIEKFILKLRDETSMHNKIQYCKKLWKLLFESAMSSIDPDKRGYDKLFKYFDEYVEFEELIFASDSFYRDHTLHCLWVYFLGEYVRWNKELQFIFEKFESNSEYFKNIYDISELIAMVDDSIVFGTKDLVDNYLKSFEYFDAERCLAALTHDLGYPLKKISKINKCVKKVMPYFNINKMEEFDFEYNAIQQNFIEEIIRIMSNHINVSERSKDGYDAKLMESMKNKVIEYIQKTGCRDRVMRQLELTQEEIECYFRSFSLELEIRKNVDDELRYFKDFEEYQHGIMSAYLLANLISSFNRYDMKYSDPSCINRPEFNSRNILTKMSILRAVADHTSNKYQVKGINTASDFLILIDEIEEFSRISRANKNRQYVNEFCKTDIYGEDGYLNIDFTFDSEEIDNLDPEFAFKGRCKKTLSVFDVPSLEENLKIRLRCIGALEYDKNVYELEIRNKYAKISINGEEKHIPSYLKSSEFSSREEYMRS